MKKNFLHYLQVELTKMRSQIKILEVRAEDSDFKIINLTAEELIRLGKIETGPD